MFYSYVLYLGYNENVGRLDHSVKESSLKYPWDSKKKRLLVTSSITQQWGQVGIRCQPFDTECQCRRREPVSCGTEPPSSTLEKRCIWISWPADKTRCSPLHFYFVDYTIILPIFVIILSFQSAQIAPGVFVRELWITARSYAAKTNHLLESL